MPDRAEANSAIVRCRTRVVPLRTVNKKLRERLAAQPAVPEDVKSENPGNRGNGNGVNVSYGSSQSARKNTASVSAEPIANSTTSSLSRARDMTCATPTQRV